MPRPIYSRSFFQGFTGAKPARETVPAGHIWVVRDIDVVVGEGYVGYFSVGVDGAGYLWAKHIPTAVSEQSYGWRGRQVLNEGQAMSPSGTPGVYFFISGYELTVV